MRILVADQNSLLLAAITATFGQHCDVVTATRRDDCLAKVEQQRFDVVIACDKLADYTGLELLSEVPVISPDSLLIFAADPKRLNQLGKRLAVFGLFDTIGYPLTPQKLVDILKRARETLSARGLPKVRHVVLESEWDTGERLGMVERELQAEAAFDGPTATHEEWARASEAGRARPESQDHGDSDDFVFAGPPPAVQAMAAPPRADARGDGRARTFEATPVAATQYEVKPAIPALEFQRGTGGGTSDDDGADEFVFAVEPDPIEELAESASEMEAAAAAETEADETASDEIGSNDPAFEGSASPEWAEDGAANDIQFGRMPVEPASWRRGGTGHLPGLTRDGAVAAGQLRKDYEAREAHARVDRGPANSSRSASASGAETAGYPVKASRRDALSSGVGGSKETHGARSAAGSHASSTARAAHADAGQASTRPGPADADSAQGQSAGRSSYLEDALAANLAAHADFVQGKTASKPATRGVPQAPKGARPAVASQSTATSQPAKPAQPESPPLPKSSQGESAAEAGKAPRAPSSKSSSQPRVRSQATPTPSQLAAFERAAARRNSGEPIGSEMPAANGKAKDGARAESTLQIEKFDPLSGSARQSLSALAKMASTKRPLSAGHLNNLAVPKKTVFAVSSGLAAALILGVLSFELLRGSGEEAEHHMPHAQPQSMQIFSPAPTLLVKGDENNTAQLAAPQPPPEELPEWARRPEGTPIQPQAQEFDPNTAPPDPPPPPVLEHPGPMEPPQPPYTRGFTGSVVDGVTQQSADSEPPPE